MGRIRDSLRSFSDPEAEIEAARQRVIKRNWRFSLLPAVVLGALVVDLGWEILRQNMFAHEWPWTITILGVTPAATLSGVFASLILAREQFARSMRPNLAWSSQLQPNKSLPGRAWTVHLTNVGPGIAHVESVRYSFNIATESFSTSKEKVSRREVVNIFRELDLQEGRDYNLQLVTAGAPLPAVNRLTDGIEFAAFNEDVVGNLQKLDFHVTVVDAMGDRHEKSLPFVATLPDDVRHSSLAVLPTPAPYPNSEPLSRDAIMPTKSRSTDPLPAQEDANQERNENGEQTIVNPHVRMAIDEKAISARDSDTSNDSFTSWTRAPG